MEIPDSTYPESLLRPPKEDEAELLSLEGEGKGGTEKRREREGVGMGKT